MAVLPKRTVPIVGNSALPRRDQRWFPGYRKRPRIQKGAFEACTSEAPEFYREQPRPATAGIIRSRSQETALRPHACGTGSIPPACLIQRNDAPPPSVLICVSEVFHVHPRSSISPRRVSDRYVCRLAEAPAGAQRGPPDGPFRF